MTDLNEWWAGLSDADRDLFTAHADTTPLPAEVVERARAAGQPTIAAMWVSSERGAGFDWPSRVQEFLEKKSAEQNP